METKILKGEQIKETIFSGIINEISLLSKKHNRTPAIAFLAFTGHQPLMKYTIGLHQQAARQLGFDVIIKTLPAESSEEEMIEIINSLNTDDSIQSIVLLQPVPKHINAFRIIEKISVEKEIEGFHPKNIIDTLTKGISHTRYPMCLPTALMELFQSENVTISKGQEFVIVADQSFISNPFRNLILKTASSQIVPSDCSFTIINSDNAKLIDYCKRADYLFVVSENPDFLPSDWLKPGVCIVDIYSNLADEIQSKNDPDKWIPIIKGGVNTESVMNIAGQIAPCPGGLMPVLLAVLFRNALKAFTNSIKDQSLS